MIIKNAGVFVGGSSLQLKKKIKCFSTGEHGSTCVISVAFTMKLCKFSSYSYLETLMFCGLILAVVSIPHSGCWRKREFQTFEGKGYTKIPLPLQIHREEFLSLKRIFRFLHSSSINAETLFGSEKVINRKRFSAAIERCLKDDWESEEAANSLQPAQQTTQQIKFFGGISEFLMDAIFYSLSEGSEKLTHALLRSKIPVKPLSKDHFSSFLKYIFQSSGRVNINLSGLKGKLTRLRKIWGRMGGWFITGKFKTKRAMSLKQPELHHRISIYCLRKIEPLSQRFRKVIRKIDVHIKYMPYLRMYQAEVVAFPVNHRTLLTRAIAANIQASIDLVQERAKEQFRRLKAKRVTRSRKLEKLQSHRDTYEIDEEFLG